MTTVQQLCNYTQDEVQATARRIVDLHKGKAAMWASLHAGSYSVMDWRYHYWCAVEKEIHKGEGR